MFQLHSVSIAGGELIELSDEYQADLWAREWMRDHAERVEAAFDWARGTSPYPVRLMESYLIEADLTWAERKVAYEEGNADAWMGYQVTPWPQYLDNRTDLW